MKTLRLAILVLGIVFLAFSFAEAISVTTKTAATYRVVENTDPVAALEAASFVLNLDLTTAEYEENDLGWVKYSTESFEIRRHVVSGHMTYINKTTEWSNVERYAEEVDEGEIADRAMAIFEKLELPLDQVDAIDVRKISAQEEDEFGMDTGPILTIGYFAQISRQIDGYPVSGSTVNVVFNAEGILHKVKVRWREIEPEPIAVAEVGEEAKLLGKISTELFGVPEIPERVKTHISLAYEEALREEEQTEFTLHYVLTYVYDEESPVMRHSISATD